MNLNNIDDLYEVNFCRSGELEWRVKDEARKNSQVYQGPVNRHVHAAECDSITYMRYDEICNESCLAHRLSESQRTKLGVGLPKDIQVFHLKELLPGVGYWKDYSCRHSYCGHGHCMKMWVQTSQKAYKSIGRYFSVQGLIYEGLFTIFRC